MTEALEDKPALELRKHGSKTPTGEVVLEHID